MQLTILLGLFQEAQTAFWQSILHFLWEVHPRTQGVILAAFVCTQGGLFVFDGAKVLYAHKDEVCTRTLEFIMQCSG